MKNVLLILALVAGAVLAIPQTIQAADEPFFTARVPDKDSFTNYLDDIGVSEKEDATGVVQTFAVVSMKKEKGGNLSVIVAYRDGKNLLKATVSRKDTGLIKSLEPGMLVWVALSNWADTSRKAHLYVLGENKSENREANTFDPVSPTLTPFATKK